MKSRSEASNVVYRKPSTLAPVYLPKLGLDHFLKYKRVVETDGRKLGQF